MKKLLATVLALSLTFGPFALPSAEGGLTLSDFSITASAEESDVDGYIYGDFRYYCDDDGNVLISKYVGDAENVVIPAEINGKKVTVISRGAFGWCTNLTGVTIPNSVTEIRYGAFKNCKSLTDVTIPDSVTKIGDHAFEYCTSLTDITIPDSVIKIGKAAFGNCRNLTDIKIPNSVKEIGEGAFWNSTSLTDITIPSSVTIIGFGAFNGCTNLQNLLVDDNNQKYSSVDGVLYNKDKTTLIQYPCANLNTDYTILDNVVAIEDRAFENSTNLVNITIPNSVIDIGNNAFSSCSSLKNITIPSNITKINQGVFYNCDRLESVTMPDNITTIDTWAFYKCTSLKDAIIPNGVTYIGDHAFEDCAKLDNIIIPNSVTKIGSYAFYGCTGTTELKLSINISGIGDYAFGFYGRTYYNQYDYDYSYNHINNFKLEVYPNMDGEEYAKKFNIPYGLHYEHEHRYAISYTTHKSCTSGAKKIFTCEYCGYTYTETIPATGHKSSAWITDKAASIGVKGSKHRECTVCKKVLETAEIPALSRISISKASVTLSTSTYAYNGKAKTPSVTVKVGGKTLKSGTDYTVSYSNNTKIGTAKVTITGKGNYTGSVSKTYSIKNDFKKATVSGISTKAFTGKNITQSITVKYNVKTLKNGTDYTVSYSSNKNIGTATVKIAGKGSYAGTITKTFKINPAKQEIQKLTAKSKAFFVDWAQKGSATGYEIQYATNSKFTSAKKVTITNNKTDKTTVSKLSGKKKYYVRVRSYTTAKGTKYYGAWSASKSVTTKK